MMLYCPVFDNLLYVMTGLHIVYLRNEIVVVCNFFLSPIEIQTFFLFIDSIILSPFILKYIIYLSFERPRPNYIHKIIITIVR